MSKKDNKYSKMCEEITKKVAGTAKEGKKPAVMSSKSDLIGMTTALLNSPEHTVTVYDKKVTEPDGSPLAIELRPGHRYRESMKPMLRAMGIDKNELDKLDEYTFSKEQGAALIDVAQTVMGDYTRAGRRLIFPITSKDSSQMSITQVRVPEHTSMPNRFRKGEDGKTRIEPTGVLMTTAEHWAAKASNRNPDWLKKSKKA